MQIALSFKLIFTSHQHDAMQRNHAIIMRYIARLHRRAVVSKFTQDGIPGILTKATYHINCIFVLCVTKSDAKAA